MNFENTPNKRIQTQNPHSWFHLHELSRTGKPKEAQSELSVARGQEEGGEGRDSNRLRFPSKVKAMLRDRMVAGLHNMRMRSIKSEVQHFQSTHYGVMSISLF